MLRQVWRWFGDLSSTRRFVRIVEPEAGPMGHGLAWRTHSRPQAISYQELMAWAEACGLSLMPWQIAALTLIDEIYRDAIDNPRAKLPDIPATKSNMLMFLEALGLKRKKQ